MNIAKKGRDNWVAQTMAEASCDSRLVQKNPPSAGDPKRVMAVRIRMNLSWIGRARDDGDDNVESR